MAAPSMQTGNIEPDMTTSEEERTGCGGTCTEDPDRAQDAPLERGASGSDSPRLRQARLTQRFAELANKSDSIDEGLAIALQAFCQIMGWSIGHAYSSVGTSTARYIDSGIWWLDEVHGCAPLVEASARSVVEPGDGFLGRVAASGRASWLDRDEVEALGGRGVAARQIGVVCGIAFPILVQSRIAGILEFYSRDEKVCEPELLEIGVQLGTELGRIVERVEFEREIARISQEERRRIGRELHDTLSQQLTGIGMLARSLEQKLEDKGDPQAGRARTLIDNIQDAHTKLRAIARGLNPVDVNATTLSSAIAEFAEQTTRTFGVRCKLIDESALEVQDDFTANQLFLLVREAVHNAAKHSGADVIRIEVTPLSEHAMRIGVHDDGRGFDTGGSAHEGMGLRTLRYRARLLGARFRIESAPGEGTSVICTVEGGVV